MYRRFVKHLIEFLIALIGAILLAIPCLIIAVAIKLDSPGNVLFKQVRLGCSQKPFKIYKFRTMVPEAFEIGGIVKTESDPRITKIGAILRKTSLDELPQLINILKGEMSIIGPRPILDFEFEPYKGNEWYASRYQERPGLFCSVDLDYRAQASRELQFEMDAEYCRSVSFPSDCKLFFGIIKTILSGSNVYRERTHIEELSVK